MPSAQSANASSGAKGRKRRRKRKSGSGGGSNNAGSPSKSGGKAAGSRIARRMPRRKKVRLNPAQLQVANKILDSGVFGTNFDNYLMHEIVHELNLTYFDDRDVTLVGQIYDALIQKKKQALLYGGMKGGRQPIVEEPETADPSDHDEDTDQAGASAGSTVDREADHVEDDDEEEEEEEEPADDSVAAVSDEADVISDDDGMAGNKEEQGLSAVTDPEYRVPSLADDTPIEDDDDDELNIDDVNLDEEDPAVVAHDQGDEDEAGGAEAKSSSVGSGTSSKRRRKRKKRQRKKKSKDIHSEPVRPPSSDEVSEPEESGNDDDSTVVSEIELNPLEIVENEIGSFDANDLDRSNALLKKWIGQLTIDEGFAEILIKLKCAESLIQKILMSKATYVSTEISNFAKHNHISIVADVSGEESTSAMTDAQSGSVEVVSGSAGHSPSASGSGSGSGKRSKKKGKRGSGRRPNSGAVKERNFRSMIGGLLTVFGYLLQGPREYHEWLIKTIFSLHLSLQSFGQPRQDELRRSFSNDFRNLIASQSMMIQSDQDTTVVAQSSVSIADPSEDASSTAGKKKRRRRRSKKKGNDQSGDSLSQSGGAKSGSSGSNTPAKIAPTAVCRKIASSVGLNLDSMKSSKRSSSRSGRRSGSKRSSTKDEADDDVSTGISTTFGTRLVGLEKYGSDLERIMEELLEREREMNKLRPTNHGSFKEAMRRMEETVERKLKKLGREESDLKKELSNINEEKKHYKLLIKQRLQPLNHNLDQLKSELSVYLKEKDDLESRLIEINNTISEYTIREEEMSNEMERMKSDYFPKETSLNERYNGLLFESKRKEKESELYLLMEKIYKLSMEKLDDWSDELIESYQSSSLKLIKEYLNQLFKFLSELNSLKTFITERINLARKHIDIEKDKHRVLPKYFGTNDSLNNVDKMKEKCQTEMNLWNEQIKKDRKIFSMLDNEMNYLLRKTKSIIETITEANGGRIFNDFLVRVHNCLGTTGGLPYTVEPSAPRHHHSSSGGASGPGGVTTATSSSSSSSSSVAAGSGYYAGHPDPTSYYGTDHQIHSSAAATAPPSAPPYVSMYVPSSHHQHHHHHHHRTQQAGAPMSSSSATGVPTVTPRVFPQTAHRAPPRSGPINNSASVSAGTSASSSSATGITIKDSSKPAEPRRRRSGHPPRTDQVYSHYQTSVTVAAPPVQRYQ